MWTRVLVVVLAVAMMVLPFEALGTAQYRAVTIGALGCLFVVFAWESRLGRFGKPLGWAPLLLTGILGVGAYWLATSGPPLLSRTVNVLVVSTILLGLPHVFYRRKQAAGLVT